MRSLRRLGRAALCTVGLGIAGVLAAPACSSDGGSGPTDDGTVEPPCDATLESLRTDVFAKTCVQAQCHDGESRAGALDLGRADVEDALVGVSSGTCEGWERVVPGDPESSLLWQKLYSRRPPCGEAMPLGQHLTALELSCVRQWILDVPAPMGGMDAGCETCGGTTCVDVTTDPDHCGACDTPCPPGSACADGACDCGSLAFCGEQCVDLQSSARHCGACGSPCPVGALCNVGECLCSGGLENCGTDCTDTSSDPAHCGACGNACDPAQVCLLGACADDCGALIQCGGSCVDTSSSTVSCGSCDNRCPSGGSCVSGQCVCPAGTAECSGACIDVFSDPQNCGACGVTCNGGLACEAGQCVCPGGGTSCGNRCVDTATDPTSCGACGITCSAGQDCVGGTCTCRAADTVSFAGQIQPIFTRECALRGCHTGIRPQEGLDLSQGRAYGSLVGAASRQCGPGRLRVAPGDPRASYIMDKLAGTNLCFGTQMPKSGVFIPAGDIDAIAAWICQGAQDN